MSSATPVASGAKVVTGPSLVNVTRVKSGWSTPMYTSAVSARPGFSNPTVALSVSPGSNEGWFAPAESRRLPHGGSPVAPGAHRLTRRATEPSVLTA